MFAVWCSPFWPLVIEDLHDTAANLDVQVSKCVNFSVCDYDVLYTLQNLESIMLLNFQQTGKCDGRV